ncbi:condensin complex protein MksE [Marinobacter sp. OP 3.4]|uniref:condensin complex protein MksE n=1 Tax=Marinobacter sp. OP 3.4 TaxID=3076501 RepID=UPI002E24E871
MEPTESPQREASNSFDDILPARSAAVYREFQAGRVIVREIWDANRSELVANPLYNLIYNHLSHFRTLYEHLGSELVFNETGAFFYLRESSDDDNEEHDENAFRVQVVLLLIGRYFARSGRDLDYLGRPDAGLKDDDLSTMDADEEYRDILRAARFEKGLPEAMDYLDKRNLVFRSGADRYFLSSAGMHFLAELVREYEDGTRL